MRQIRTNITQIFWFVTVRALPSGLESDMIVALNDGRWAAIEVKLGNKQIEEAAQHLQELARKVDDEKMGHPSFLMVLTGGEYAYQRKDGVLIVPIGCLKD